MVLVHDDGCNLNCNQGNLAGDTSSSQTARVPLMPKIDSPWFAILFVSVCPSDASVLLVAVVVDWLVLWTPNLDYFWLARSSKPKIPKSLPPKFTKSKPWWFGWMFFVSITLVLHVFAGGVTYTFTFSICFTSGSLWWISSFWGATHRSVFCCDSTSYSASQFSSKTRNQGGVRLYRSYHDDLNRSK